jgi:hypothetical protein
MTVARKNPVESTRGQGPWRVIPAEPEQLQDTQPAPRQQVLFAAARLGELLAGLASRSTMTLTAAAAWLRRRAQL